MKKKIFKRISVLVAAAMLLLPCACAPASAGGEDGGDERVEISLWTFPVGGWGNLGIVSSQLTAFHRENPDIRVTVNTLDYNTGDKKINEALANGTAPDLVLEGPERLVAGWGAQGVMADISDLWTGEAADKIYENVRVACHDGNGKYYIYPMCMTTHCMAINKDLFVKADAWQYIDEKTRTWTTENFFKAVAALKSYGMERVAAVCCGGQGGDQGTRALVNNLYGGTFTDSRHTQYTVESEENIRALEELKAADGIDFAPDMVGADEIAAFCRGDLAMAFCWNVSMEVQETINMSFNFDIFPMAFPANDEKPDLQGGIWGFGVFDNGDDARIAAAKKFIRYIMENDARYSSAVNVSTYSPVRSMPDLYLNDKLMNEYSIFGDYLGDYYQVAPHWAAARTAWWTMLQAVGEGTSARDAVRAFTAAVTPAE